MNLNIRSKLVLSFTLLLTVLIVVGLFMTLKLRESNARLIDISNVTGKKVNLSHEVLIGVLEAARHEKNLLLESSESQKEYYKTRLYAALNTIDEKTSELEKLVDDEGKLMLSQFTASWAEYKEDIRLIVSSAMQNETENAFKISRDKGLQVRDLAIAQLGKLIDKNQTTMHTVLAENKNDYNWSLNFNVWLISASILLVILISYLIVKSITGRIHDITTEAQKIASRAYVDATVHEQVKDEMLPVFNALININESFREVTLHANRVALGNYNDELVPRSENDLLGHSLKKMTLSLRDTTATNEKHNWLSTGKNLLNEKLAGNQSIEEFSSNAIGFLCHYLNANIGAVYVWAENDKALVLRGEFAFLSMHDAKQKFGLNEGLIGQAASQQKSFSVNNISEAQLRITSALLNAKPAHVQISPFLHEGRTMGVIEIGRLTPFTSAELEFLESSMDTIGLGLHSAIARKRIHELLEETQVQSEELQSQQEELRQVNEELEEQAQGLKQQQEELQMTNEELEEQTQSLEMKNREVEAARQDIEAKTKQLEISSRYKSEFLANMSHELRTPLNSLLILSKDLAENKRQNLDDDQVESAEIIHKSGNDLLMLINEVLDLSKIEAGKMTVNVERVVLKILMNSIIRDFKLAAEQKGLSLDLVMENNLPMAIRTDQQRMGQILKNLISNAIKFTPRGKITLGVHNYDDNRIIISVSDTGIGIPEEKQRSVFEAFQQADGGTSRKYGGTGLGLSISREMAKLLGGEITLSSTVDEGSVFSLIIPVEIKHDYQHKENIPQHNTRILTDHIDNQHGFLNYPTVEDDRHTVKLSDKTVLIIEDDLKFAAILQQQAKQKGFKCLSAATGEDGLMLAKKYKPNAIILDLDLPGMSGKKVLNILKDTPAVRHIPVHIISVNERTLEPIKEGAVEYLVKPVAKNELEEAFNRIENFVNRKMRNLLIVEDDPNSRKAMRKLIGNGDVQCFEAGTGHDALKIYKENHIDCIVLDIGLPDISGFELIYKLENIKDSNVPPIIIYTGRELTREENHELQRYAESIIIKGVKSEDRLLDETALFLHRTISSMPEAKQNIINKLYDKEAVFQQKKILVVDDDMRNVFALSKLLKDRGMEILKADNGRTALEMLNQHPDINLVLMDIMMPEMDGYEAMRQIRAQHIFKNLPIIALTAKAMKDDKQKCIDAGANDYVSKPVDTERLLLLMRLWLGKQ